MFLKHSSTPSKNYLSELTCFSENVNLRMFHHPVQHSLQEFPEYHLQNFENCHISLPENFDFRSCPSQNNFNNQNLKLNENPQINPESKSLTLEELRKIAKAEKRKKRRATLKYRTLHASRER